jgi:hypothetical protein
VAKLGRKVSTPVAPAPTMILQLAEEVFDQMPPFVDFEVNREGRLALGPL